MRGVLYRRTQDPRNADGRQCLYAPDVARGPDGRYYLYYALDGTSMISVAVCDTPAGAYEYYGDVAYPDGTPLGARAGDEHQFDPGVLAEGDGAWLYSGFCPPLMPGRTGARVVRLAADMRTVVSDPVTVVPGAQTAKGTGFEGHAFFEASSIRKANGRYYFIYSSELSHELCYATADAPTGPFAYGGTLVSNADLGLRTMPGTSPATTTAASSRLTAAGMCSTTGTPTRRATPARGAWSPSQSGPTGPSPRWRSPPAGRTAARCPPASTPPPSPATCT